jgi:hypothetical protein
MGTEFHYYKAKMNNPLPDNAVGFDTLGTAVAPLA